MTDLESEVKKLRLDMNKLIAFTVDVEKSNQRTLDLLDKFIFQFNRRYERMREQLEHTFGAVFPKNDRYLDEIEAALRRARKRGD